MMMPRLPEELRETFAQFESGSEQFSEHDVSAAVNKIRREIEADGREITPELQAESMAFDFCEDYRDDKTGWGTYYGPMMVSHRDGDVYESPSIKAVTPEILAYWQTRSQEAQHPLLQCRYAGLIWDFSPQICSSTADIVCARTVIDTSVRIANDRLYEHESQAIDKLERALTLAMSTNDATRVRNVIEAVIHLEETTGNIEHLGTWGFAYDLLVQNKKVPITDEERCRIIASLEKILTAVASKVGGEGGLDPFAAEHAGLRLAGYYRRVNRPEDVRRVLQLYANAFLVMAEKASPMLGAAWLNKVFDVLNQFGCREDAVAIATVLRELSSKGKDEMIHHTEKVEISKEEIDGFIGAMLEGSAEEVLVRIAVQFTPNPDELETQVKELAKSAPLMSIMPMSLVDAEGREIGKVGGVEEDLEGRVIHQMSQNMQFEASFLRYVLAELPSKGIDVAAIVDHIFGSPIFESRRRPVVEKGITAWLGGDHVVAAHVLIPQIEQALRQLVVLSGRSAYKPNRRHGGIQLKVLDDLLRDQATEAVLSVRTVTYVKVLLTDPRGWNLRNDVCHGIIDPSRLGWATSDRVLHVLLLLALLRKREDESAAPSDPNSRED